jgi:HEAT repeat protein
MSLTAIALVAMAIDVSQLAAALSSRDPAERTRAAEQLARLGPDARPAAVALVSACGDPAEEVCQWSTAALEGLGPPSPQDVETLASLLRSESPDVGYWAATLLGRLEDQGAPAVSRLADGVSGDLSIPVRQRAAWALGKIGPRAAAAIGALEAVAAGEDPRLARLAQRALGQIRR